MRLTYKGKSAVVTGASGGMGLETTKKQHWHSYVRYKKTSKKFS